MWGLHKREPCIPNAEPPTPKDPCPCRSTLASGATDTRHLLVDRDMTPTCENSQETRPCHHDLALKSYCEQGKQSAFDNLRRLAEKTPEETNSTGSQPALASNDQPTSIISTATRMTKSSTPPSFDPKPSQAKFGQIRRNQNQERPKLHVSAVPTPGKTRAKNDLRRLAMTKSVRPVQTKVWVAKDADKADMFLLNRDGSYG